jgi:pentatricopeptide repeat protein
VHTRREDWLAVQEVLNRRLEVAEDDFDRIEIYMRLAQVSAEKRESVDEAIGYYHQILDVDTGHLPTFERLELLLTQTERWHDLVELFERLAKVYADGGDATEEIRQLANAAEIWEGKLESPDAAGEILEKILERDPDSVPALTRLAKIYEGAGDWDKCGEVLQKALALGPTGRDAADLFFRLGEVAREQSGDVDKALESYQQALEHQSDHGQAVEAVEAISRDREDWPTVAEMVRRRESASRNDAERLELTLELAELYGKKLGQPEEVIPLLEQAASKAADDPRVVGPLADLYFAAGRHDEATPLYETMAEHAKKARKMKDVGRYRQRLAGIHEAKGDEEAALTAYEEAFRTDPTNVATMAGLGRIYMNRQDWEKARRVYRSMVLQNIDPDLGITKADVYYALGRIHLELDEKQKAKGMFQRGLEVDPDHAGINEAMSGLS